MIFCQHSWRLTITFFIRSFATLFKRSDGPIVGYTHKSNRREIGGRGIPLSNLYSCWDKWTPVMFCWWGFFWAKMEEKKNSRLILPDLYNKIINFLSKLSFCGWGDIHQLPFAANEGARLFLIWWIYALVIFISRHHWGETNSICITLLTQNFDFLYVQKPLTPLSVKTSEEGTKPRTHIKVMRYPKPVLKYQNTYRTGLLLGGPAGVHPRGKKIRVKKIHQKRTSKKVFWPSAGPKGDRGYHPGG